MFDPRSDIKALFTSNRVTGTDKYSNTAHVDIFLREENEEGVIAREGIIIFEPPWSSEEIKDADIGGSYDYIPINFDASLYVIRKRNISDYPTFINSIVNTFRTTVKTNRHSLTSCDDAKVTMLYSPAVPTQARKMEFKRTMQVTCWKLTS